YTGGVFINGVTASDPRVPVGGVKNSGYGRQLSHFGAHAFVKAQTVWIENAQLPDHSTQAALTKNAAKRSLSKWRADIAPGQIGVRRHATNIHQPYARRRKANVGGSRGQGRKLRHSLLRRRGRCRWSLSGLPTPGRRARCGWSKCRHG